MSARSVFGVVASFLLVASVIGQQFSSTVEITKFLENEKSVLNSLRNYIYRQEKIGQPVEENIKNAIQLLKDENNKSISILPVTTALTVFHFLSRASRDWARLHERVTCEEHDQCPFLTGADGNANTSITDGRCQFDKRETQKPCARVIDVVRKREGILWPEKRDVIQAALGVLNVWSVFDLDLATLTSGALSTGQSKPMSGDDIFFIGNSARDSGKLFEAITWFQYLVDHWSSFKVHEVKYTALVRTLAMALKEYGMTQRGIELLQKARDKEPADTALVRDLNYLLTTTDGRDVGKALQPVQAPADDVAIQEERFQDICRSSLNKDWPVTPKQLHCYRLRLWNYYGFSKLELLSWLPRIELIYDVINKMEAGTLIAQSGNEIVFKQRDRLGTTAYGLVDERHLSAPICEWNKAFPSLLTKVTQRLESATHLYLRHAYKNPSSDCFRMSNLGPGVPTWPRTDYFDKEMFLHTHTGNRLATIMIQLNDVAHGGQLVFPQLNITIPTIQGSAVIWENLKRNGQPSDRSIHRNCPSLVGPHWGLFKNVFYSNQLFRRRCMQYKNILFS